MYAVSFGACSDYHIIICLSICKLKSIIGKEHLHFECLAKGNVVSSIPDTLLKYVHNIVRETEVVRAWLVVKSIHQSIIMYWCHCIVDSGPCVILIKLYPFQLLNINNYNLKNSSTKLSGVWVCHLILVPGV